MQELLVAIADLCAPTSAESLDDWMRRAVKEDVFSDNERMQANRSLTAPDGPGGAFRMIESIRAKQPVLGG